VVQLADHLQQVVGQGCHVPFTVHLPQPAEPGPRPAEPVQRGEGSFRDGAAPEALPLVLGSPVPLSGPQAERVKHREADVSPLLSGREAVLFHWAGLAILLKSHILVGQVLSVKVGAGQCLALGTHQVVAMKSETSLGDRVVFLDGMDGYIGLNVRSSRSSLSCPAL